MDADYEVETATLRDVADATQAEGDTLRTQRLDPAPAPDAGRSSGEVAGSVAHLVDSAADLANLCEHIAANLAKTAGRYEDADAATVAELERLGRSGPGLP